MNKKENDQWGKKEWREHWGLNKKENLDNKSKWINGGYANETKQVRKNIPKEIIIWSVNDLF